MLSNVWNGDGFWTASANWSLGAPPDSLQNALIQTGTVILNAAAFAANVVIDNNATQTLFVTGAAASLTAANLTAFGNFYMDTDAADGGSAVSIGGTFVNYSNAVIGNSALTASVTMNVGRYVSGSLGGYGNLTLQGAQTLGTSFQAALVVNSAAPTVLLGSTYLGGAALLQYQSGGVTTIGTGASLLIYGQQARVSIGAGTGNSALTGLAYILGTLDLEGSSTIAPGGATVATTPSLRNIGTLRLDASNGRGASLMTVGGTLTNTGAVVVGNSGLVANATLDVGNLVNLGSINLWGEQTAGATHQAVLKVEAAAPSIWTGGLFVHGDADVIFASGGVTSIAAGAQIQIDGQQARLSLGAGVTNSALTGLASNYGIFDEEGDATTGPGGAAVTTSALFTNANAFRLDVDANAGASAFTDTKLFTNDDDIQIGNDFLSANTTLTVAGLVNNGTLYVASQRLAGAHPLAAAMVNSAAPAAWIGGLRVAGNSLVHYLSGAITSLAAGAGIELDGNAANVAVGAGARNSALATLASNAGTFALRGGSGFGSGVILTTAGYNNAGTTRIDSSGADGGSAWTLSGALVNSGAFEIGNAALSAATTVNATTFSNTGSLTLQGASGASSPPTAVLALSGAANPVVGGYQRIAGAARLSFGAGAGYTVISNTGRLELDGQKANIKVGPSGAQNSGIAALASNAGTFALRGGSPLGAGGVSVSTGVSLSNSGALDVDNSVGDGGSVLSVGGTLNNSGALNIGNAALAAATTVTAAGFFNTGNAAALILQGGASLGAAAATFNVAAASAATLANSIRVGGAATLHFGLGAGVSVIAATGGLELDGAQASVAVAAGGQNSGLAKLYYNLGALILRGGASFGQGGVALSTSTTFTNANLVQIDGGGGEGGSAVSFGGALTNRKFMDIGNASLTGATRVQATTLNNIGSLTLHGHYLATGPRATLALSGAAPNSVTNALRIGGTATMSFGSGLGFRTIASGGFLEIDGAQAQVVAGAGGPVSGVANLVSNAGRLTLRGDSNFGQGGVTLATAGGFVNLGVMMIDCSGGDGASALAFNGALSNQGTFTLGNSGLGVASSVSAKGVYNYAGQIDIEGGGGGGVATMSSTGAIVNYAAVIVGANAQLSAAGVYTQTGGATTIGGTLSSGGFTQWSGTTTVSGTLASSLVNVFGGIVLYSSELTAGSQTTALNLQNGAVLQFYAGVSSSQNLAFQDATDLLQLYAPISFHGNVTGFVGGDVIDLMHQGAAASLNYAGGVLSVLDAASNLLDAFKLSGGAYTTASFSLVDDLNGGKLIYV